jgi:hypothetical protein
MDPELAKSGRSAEVQFWKRIAATSTFPVRTSAIGPYVLIFRMWGLNLGTSRVPYSETTSMQTFTGVSFYILLPTWLIKMNEYGTYLFGDLERWGNLTVFIEDTNCIPYRQQLPLTQRFESESALDMPPGSVSAMESCGTAGPASLFIIAQQ